MNVDIINMPAERVFRVALDGDVIQGYLKRDVKVEKYTVHLTAKDTLKTTPHSREAAACLLLFQHFTRERRVIEEREAKAQEAADARQAAGKGEAEAE